MTAVAAYLAEIWRKRYFWFSLVKMDLKRRYRRSLLGIGWSLLNPILMTCVFCTVFAKLFGENITDYAPFVLSGLAFWSFFSGVTNEGCQCYFAGENYIRQHPAPLAIYPLRATLSMLIHFGIALVVLLALVWGVRGFGNLTALWAVVPALAIVFLFAWSVAACIGVLNVYFPDVQHLVSVGLQVLFYLTPVFYSGTMLAKHRLQWLMDCNPLAACIELFRAPILDGRLPSWNIWAFTTAVTAATVVLAGWTLSRVEKRLVFHM